MSKIRTLGYGSFSKSGSVVPYKNENWVAVRDTNTLPPDGAWRPAVISDPSLLPKNGKDGRDGISPQPAKDGDPGLVWRGLWSRRATYKKSEAVTWEGSSYICVADETRREPSPESNAWDLLASVGDKGRDGKQGGAGQRGRSSIALQNEMREQIAELTERVDELVIDGVTTVSALFVDSVSKGMPIRIDTDSAVHLAIGQFRDGYALSYWGCDGLALDDVEAGGTASYATDGIIELDDWSAVTGAEFLSPGSNYVLSETEPGKLTKWDSQAEYLLKQIIGTALSPTQLDIEIQSAYYSSLRNGEFDSECLSFDVVYATDDGHLDRAKADDLATAAAVAFSWGNWSAGEIGKYRIHGPAASREQDWTRMTGSVELVPGPYWLSDTDAGKMTNVEPTSPGHYRVKLGEATDANTFFILIEPPELIT